MKKLLAVFLLMVVPAAFTKLQAQYCVPSQSLNWYGCSDGDMIDNFVLNGANSTAINDAGTGCTSNANSYDDRTSESVSLCQSLSYTATVSTQYYPDDNLVIWIDFNDNFTFEASEVVASFASVSTSGSQVSIVIPSTAALGTHRMRAMLGYDIAPLDLDPCNNTNQFDYGETHDYTVVILPPPSCIPPNSLTASNITSASAMLSWSDGGGSATDYRIEYGPQGFTPGTGNFIFNSGTSYNLMGLAANTAYSYYVRAICSASDSSAQIGPFSFTTLCTATSIPYTENFDGVTAPAVPNCMTIQDANTDGTTWFTNDYEYNSAPNAMTYSADYNYYNPGDDWFFTQGLQLTGGITYQVSFRYAAADSYSPESLEVKAGTSPASSAMTSSALFYDAAITNTNFTNTSLIYTPSTTGTYYFGWHCFSQALEYELYVDDINIDVAPSCVFPTGLIVTNPTFTSVNLGWTNNSSASQFRVEWGPQGFTPGTGNFELANTNPYTVNGLTMGTAYDFYVRALCSATDSSSQTGPYSYTTPVLADDDAPGAILLTVGAGCTGTPYTNTGATLSGNEPFPSCNGNAAYPVWFKFVAPASGFVKISNDFSANTVGDTKMALFSATNPSDYNTFSIITCDDDNGIVGGSYSMFYASGLTPGNTYYIAMDNYASYSSQGDFCITVDDVTPSMLATAPTSCTVGQPTYADDGYSGWISLADDDGKLIANIRNTAGTPGNSNGFEPSLTINSGSTRSYGYVPYLDRNFLITVVSGVPTGPFDVKFFFLNSELSSLGTSISNINITRQSGSTCMADFSGAGGTNYPALLQNNNGTTSSGVDWIQFQTPGFSNYYIQQGNVALSIKLTDFSGNNAGSRNLLEWKTASEENGDVFTLQRSFDGKNFSDMYAVNANGKASTYSYWDNSPVAGINHYRLKMEDVRGGVVYSTTIQINVNNRDGAFAVEAYPNPITDAVKIKVYGTTGADAQLQLSDVTGRINRIIKMNGNETSLDVHDLPAGVYLLRYMDDTNSKTIKLNKK